MDNSKAINGNLAENIIENAEGKESKKAGGVNKKTVFIAIGIVAIALIVIAILVEALKKNAYSIVNNTSEEIEYIKVYFEDVNNGNSYCSDYFIDTKVGAKAKTSGSYVTPAGHGSYATRLMFIVKFAGREETVNYSGYFTSEYSGKITIKFIADSEDSNNILMKVKAGEGITNSASNTYCDETISLYVDKLVSEK